MKLLVLGASGGCGQWVVRLGRKRGHEVTALVRPTSSYVAPEGVTLLGEEFLSDGVLEKILPGHQAVISISSGGVTDSSAHTHWLLRLLFNRSNISISHTDLAKMEELYADSGLDWLAIRPITLKDGGPTSTAKPVSFYGWKSKITKGEVARLILDAAPSHATGRSLHGTIDEIRDRTSGICRPNHRIFQ